MNVMVNGETRNVPEGQTVREILSFLNYQFDHLAVAINHECVPRSTFDEHLVNDGDDIEILSPMAGG